MRIHIHHLVCVTKFTNGEQMKGRKIHEKRKKKNGGERVIAIKFAVQLLHQHENLLVFWPKRLEAKRLIMVRKILSPEKKSHQTAYKFNIIPFSALAQLPPLPLPLPLNIKANQLFFFPSSYFSILLVIIIIIKKIWKVAFT